jgi:hypothetical protein
MGLPSRIGDVRAALWAHRALGATRRRLAHSELRPAIAPPPRLPASAGRGVESLLRRRRHTCLEGALVRQRWHAAQGRAYDVVIGVTSPAGGFTAHAWLEDPAVPPVVTQYTEIKRVAP